ncbi:hypothetical protein Hanom_Chr16g01418451 [Helianthus anomalus]
MSQTTIPLFFLIYLCLKKKDDFLKNGKEDHGCHGLIHANHGGLGKWVVYPFIHIPMWQIMFEQ